MGLPVLSGGEANPLVFIGPKGGYVLGFCLQAYLMGWFVERSLFSRSLALLAGGLLACTVQMAAGICVLAQFVGWKHVWFMGLYPFVPGEFLKIVTTAIVLASPTKMAVDRLSRAGRGVFHRF